MKTCLDCLHCKVKLKDTILKCKREKWGKVSHLSRNEYVNTYANLGNLEIVVRQLKKIRYKYVFDTAERCELYNEMD